VHDSIQELSRALSPINIGTKKKGLTDVEGQSLPSEKGYIEEHRQSPKVVRHQDSTSLAPSSGWAVHEGSLDQATLPLMLLKPKIQEALSLLTLCKPGQAHLSKQDTNWIQEELESLLVVCHETAAVTLKNPNSTFKHNASHTTQTNADTNGAPRCRAEKARQVGKTNQIATTKFLVRESPAGNVSARVQCIQNPDSGNTAVSDIVLLLAPNPAIHKHGFAISLARLNEKLRQPRIHRSISMYTVVEPDSPIFECVQSNNIGHLRQLLGSRQVTPDIRNTENESLLSVRLVHCISTILTVLNNYRLLLDTCGWNYVSY
jgi:hypothetical protein